MNLVVGATGSLGGKIAQKLLERGEAVRILARRQSDYRALEEAGAEVAIGDLKEPESLPAALKGIDKVVTTANSAGRGGADTVETVDRRGTADLIGAASAAGVERFVYVSTAAAALDSPVPFFRAKAENEVRLTEGNMEYTILQAVLFMEVWIGAFLGSQLKQGPKVQLIGEGRKKVAFVAADDVAELAVRALVHPQARNAAIPISAAAMTYRDIVHSVEEVTGMEIEIETLEPGQTLDRLPPPMQATMTGLMTGLALGPETDMTTPEVARTYGIEFRPIEAFLRQTFGQAAAAN